MASVSSPDSSCIQSRKKISLKKRAITGSYIRWEICYGQQFEGCPIWSPSILDDMDYMMWYIFWKDKSLLIGLRLRRLGLANTKVGGFFTHPKKIGQLAKLSHPACKGWVALSSLVCLSFVRPASVTSPLISIIWCFRPYKAYIFC